MRGFSFGESKWNLCISTFSICEIQKKSSLPQENYILRPKLKLKCISILAVVLIAYPENRLIRQIVDHAVDGVGVGVVVVPGAASHRGQQVHGSVLVSHDAVGLAQGSRKVLVAVEALHLDGSAVVVAGGS